MTDDQRSLDPGTKVSGQSSASGLEAARPGTLLDAIPQMVWTTRPDGSDDFLNQRWSEFTGPAGDAPDGAGWAGRVHPDDQLCTGQRWCHCLRTGERFEAEFRLRDGDGAHRWVLGQAVPIHDQDGAITRWCGTFTDISALKANEDQLELLAGELSHRLKNVFAVVSGIISLSSREWPEAGPFAEVVLERIGALARAHDYVRSSGATPAAVPGGGTLRGLIQALMEAYNDDARTRVTTGGINVQVGLKAATALALVLHEQATNAAKHGALSIARGSVDILVERIDDVLLIHWRERGGPAVPGPPAARGFGTTMSRRVAAAQLDAAISTCWREAGVEVTIRMPVERLAQ